MDDFQPKQVPNALPTGLDGTRSIAEINEAHPGVPMVKLGKQTIKDAGRRLAQIQGLKPGSSSIRTPEMIEEILKRLSTGETLTSITCDTTMPAISTLWYWCDKDAELDAAITKAQATGQRTLADLRLNIAAGGEFSTGDTRRDDLLIKAINANIAQRNRNEFGDKQHHTVEVGPAPVMLPIINVPELPPIEHEEADADDD